MDAQVPRPLEAARPFPDFANRDTIGGRPAYRWKVYSSGRYLTGVRFDNPRIFITGIAANERELATHLALYRTVRFPGAESGGDIRAP